MSFFSSNFGARVPGRVCGNVLDGLCERACIQVFKVFDSALIQRQITESVTIVDNNPQNPTNPLTFVSAESISQTAIIQNLSIIRFPDRPNFARVSGEVVIPIKVNYLDANNVPGFGYSSVTIPFDVVMHVPQDALIAPEVQATAQLIANIGKYVGNNTFDITACVNIVLRVGCPAELLVPTYGYCLIPKAVDFNDNVCSGFFDLPLYPNQPRRGNNNGTTIL